MFLVGGGIITHGFSVFEHFIHGVNQWLTATVGNSHLLEEVSNAFINGSVGLIWGAALVLGISGLIRIKKALITSA